MGYTHKLHVLPCMHAHRKRRSMEARKIGKNTRVAPSNQHACHVLCHARNQRTGGVICCHAASLYVLCYMLPCDKSVRVVSYAAMQQVCTG